MKIVTLSNYRLAKLYQDWLGIIARGDKSKIEALKDHLKNSSFLTEYLEVVSFQTHVTPQLTKELNLILEQVIGFSNPPLRIF